MRINIVLAILFVSAHLGFLTPDIRAGETEKFVQRFVLINTILVPTNECPRDPGPYESECILHIIFKGDTLGSIARYYQISEQKLKQFNPWVRGKERNLPIRKTLILPKIIAENRIIAEYKKENEALGKENEKMQEEMTRLQEDLTKRDADFYEVNRKNIEVAIRYFQLEEKYKTNQQRIIKLRAERDTYRNQRDTYISALTAALYSVAELEGERIALEEKLRELYARVKEANERREYWQNEFEKQKATRAAREKNELSVTIPAATPAP